MAGDADRQGNAAVEVVDDVQREDERREKRMPLPGEEGVEAPVDENDPEEQENVVPYGE